MTAVTSYCKLLTTLVLVSPQGKPELFTTPDFLSRTPRCALTRRQTSADNARSIFPHKKPPLTSFLSDGCHFSPVTGWYQCLLIRKRICNNTVIITNSPSFICSFISKTCIMIYVVQPMLKWLKWPSDEHSCRFYCVIDSCGWIIKKTD